MELKSRVKDFIAAPVPLWENRLTQALIRDKFAQLKSAGIFENEDDYHTSGLWLKNGAHNNGLKENLFPNKLSTTCLEHPCFEYLGDFYSEHGLIPKTDIELVEGAARLKLEGAFSLLNYHAPCFQCVTELVKAVQVVKQEHQDYDVSYSHPNLPFTIFVSVCDDISLASNLRVAENILHEAMHLKLTLIESLVPMAEAGTNATFYSPWRDEQRPVSGVLHGLFVFRAIMEFYKKTLFSIKGPKEHDFALWRIEQIESELKTLRGFPICEGLTKDGASLSANLLPSN